MSGMNTNAAGKSGPAGAVIPQWSLGDRLRKARRTMGLSQAEFAKRLGENVKTYAAWELDTSAPRNVVAVAKRVEIATGVSAAWVLGVEPPEPTPYREVITRPNRRRYQATETTSPQVLALRRRAHDAAAVRRAARSRTGAFGGAA